MKTIKTEKQKIAALTKLAKKKSRLPITDVLRFDPTKLVAHKLDAAIAIEQPFRVTGEGTINAQDFKKVHDSAVIENVTFEGGKAIVETNNGEFKFDSYDYQDFPALPNNLEQVGSIEIDGKFDVAKKYTGRDDFRPVMQSVYIDKTESHIVATDAHRIYFEPIDTSNLKSELLIDKRVFDFVQHGINSVRKDGTWIKMSCNGVDVYTRYEGKFPQWKTIIPEYSNCLTVNKKSFEKKNKLALIAANSTTNKVELSEGATSISAQDFDFDKRYDSLIDGSLKGDFCRIAYNGKFMLDLLKDCDDEVTIQTVAPNKAILISGKFVIMPVRLDD